MLSPPPPAAAHPVAFKLLPLLQGPYFVDDATTPYPQHLANVYRGSAGRSNSGFLVSSSSSNAVVEGSAFDRSDRCVTVQGGTDLILVRGSACSSAD